MAPALVALEDLVVCNLEGEVVSPADARTYVERFIHSEIYKSRPDVHSVVHSHSPAVIPFGVTGARLRPICHMSGFLGAQVPVYEIRNAIGETSDLLIRNQMLGQTLAQSLGHSMVVLMRGHGSVVVGSSIKQSVFRAIYTENNARLQMQAAHLGEINFLTEAEAHATSEMNDLHLDRPWEMWHKRVLKAR
jgi:HCOMODA/2-hydroxy-3-carboxy-muconic semialdehyde decarboxylase